MYSWADSTEFGQLSCQYPPVQAKARFHEPKSGLVDLVGLVARVGIAHYISTSAQDVSGGDLPENFHSSQMSGVYGFVLITLSFYTLPLIPSS
jgi:hypothetical protein